MADCLISNWCGVPRIFHCRCGTFPVQTNEPPSSTKQTHMVKFNALTILTLKNYCWLLCCIVCLLGIAIP